MTKIDARVTGFNYTTFYTYTTEVKVDDGRKWTLNIRYNTFYQFYTHLLMLEKHFKVNFPPKGSLFSSPPPEERREQLDEFLSSTLYYFEMRRRPKRMGALLDELLEIPQHLKVKEEDDERTASEGSFDEHDDSLDSGLEDVKHPTQFYDYRVENDGLVNHHERDDQTLQAINAEETVEIAPAELESKREAVEAQVVKSECKNLNDHRLSSGALTNDYLIMLRRRTLSNAMAVAMSEKSIVAKATNGQQENKAMKNEVETQDDETRTAQPASVLKDDQNTVHKDLAQAAPKSSSVVVFKNILEPVASIGSDLGKTPAPKITQDDDAVSMSDAKAKSVQGVDSSSDEASEEVNLVEKKESEPENLVLSWFRRMSSCGLSLSESKKQKVTKTRQEEEADAKIRAKAEEEAEAEAHKAKLLYAEQELNLRLKRYRHPVFFQGFNCDIGTSCYSLPELASHDIIV